MKFSNYIVDKWVEVNDDCQHNTDLIKVSPGILKCPVCECYINEDAWLKFINNNSILVKKPNKEIVTAGKKYINIGIGLMPTTEKQYIVKNSRQERLFENIKYQLDYWDNLNG